MIKVKKTIHQQQRD